MDSEYQLRLSIKEYDSIKGLLEESNIKFRFCTKHQRYEKNFRTLKGKNECNDRIKVLTNLKK